jgi:TonB-dependent receptor
LNPTRANNYDLLYEKFLNPLGLIQAGVFYKQLSNPIYGIKTITSNPLYPGYELDQPINGRDARLYGFEIAYQQRLTFLPGLLSGLGFSGNYGYTNSVTDGIPNRTDRPHLQRQAPNTWNISPTYDRGRLSIRVGISYNDANVFSYHYFDIGADGKVSPPPLGKNGPNGDTYIYAHTQVDAQGSFRMYRGLEFIASGLNLTNEVFGFYNGSQIYPIQREYYKPSFAFGLRWQLHQER